jgi:hypothetical protein
MFDKYMIVEEGFRNVSNGGKVTGFELGARLPYYRGLGLSMVENIALSVDGTPVPRENLRLAMRGRTWTLAELETEYDEAWGMGEVAKVQVLQEGGLKPGAHQLELTEQLRVSYMPFPTIGKDTKTLVL